MGWQHSSRDRVLSYTHEALHWIPIFIFIKLKNKTVYKTMCSVYESCCFKIMTKNIYKRNYPSEEIMGDYFLICIFSEFEFYIMNKHY
jgi:hypothetical protein